MNASPKFPAVHRSPKITIMVKKPGGACEEYVYEASSDASDEPLLTVHSASDHQPEPDLLALSN